MKEQLKAAMADIAALREENIELRSMSGVKKPMPKTEDTFITKGSDNP